MAKRIAASEVAKHTTADSAWVIIQGQVFDVSKFHESHPGGAKILLRACGKDATKQFTKFHNDKVLTKYTPKLKIGDVSEEAKL